MNNIKVFKKIFINLLIIFTALISFKHSYQHALPYYLSASLDYSFGQKPKYNQNEVDEFNKESSGTYSIEKGLYTFKKKPDSHSNNEHVDHFGYSFSHGFVIYIKIAKFIFGHLGDLNSIILMNLLTHIISFNLIYSLFKLRSEKYLFLLLFGLNPLLLHLATFPYYYYPISVIPAFILYVKKTDDRRGLLVLSFLSVISVIRLTIIPIIMVGAIYLIKDRVKLIFTIIILFSIYYCVSKLTYGSYEPYYTAVIGLGAYQNSYGYYLADSFALDILKSNNLYLTEDISIQLNFLREYLFEKIKSDPVLYINNVIKNIFILFGGGYFVGHQTYNNIMIFAGFSHLIYLIKYRYYDIILLIISSAIAVIVLFPPIPAYIAPAYTILMYSVTKICSKILNTIR